MVENEKSCAFLSFDLNASFAKGSDGQATKRMIDRDGSVGLEGVVWDWGHLAYEHLREGADGMSCDDIYRSYVSSALKFLRDHVVHFLSEQIQNGRLSLTNGSLKEFRTMWKKCDWVDQLKIYLQASDEFGVHLDSKGEEMALARRAYIAAALLFRIDEVNLCDFTGINTGLIERVIDLVELREFFEPTPKHQLIVKAAVGAARKQIGKAGATARLAKDPKQRAKLSVRECWELWQKEPSRYKGPTAFANDMLGKFEELQSKDVVMRWNREWKSDVT